MSIDNTIDTPDNKIGDILLIVLVVILSIIVRVPSTSVIIEPLGVLKMLLSVTN